MGGLPKALRNALTTFSGVASNFAGVPLAFAFIATMGRVGLVTTLLKSIFGISLYDAGFNLYSFGGLSLTYLYFQIPLMVLVMLPALDGIRPEWREACDNLGANGAHYWRHVALPVLMPSLLSSVLLLFGNAFGAYATAYALTGGFINLVPIQIGAQIRGDVLHDPNLGFALALGMVVIMILTILGYSALHGRAARWRR
jgi:putative spermidine/putrescine transport system permease protein